MALLNNRKRWVNPLEAVYLLGMVKCKPGDSAEVVKRAEHRAMDTLSHVAVRWGIVKVKRGEGRAGVAYTEESLLAYQAARERAA